MKIALIPARSGSKRLPNKNTLPLGGKPLISHTIEAVINAKVFDLVIVSSDDTYVLEIAEGYDEVETWIRPNYLATDTATTSQVLIHILDKINIDEGICGIFLPTSPFRSSYHIKKSLNLLSQTTDSVISVTKYPIPIGFRMQFKNNRESELYLPENSILKNGSTRTQEHSEFVHPNGAIYLGYIKSFRKYNTFFLEKVKGLLMNRYESIDIDTIEDYEFAKAVYGGKTANGV